MSTQYKMVVELENNLVKGVYDPETSCCMDFSSAWYLTTMEIDEDEVRADALTAFPDYEIVGFHFEWRNLNDGEDNSEGPAWNKAR